MTRDFHQPHFLLFNAIVIGLALLSPEILRIMGPEGFLNTAIVFVAVMFVALPMLTFILYALGKDIILGKNYQTQNPIHIREIFLAVSIISTTMILTELTPFINNTLIKAILAIPLLFAAYYVATSLSFVK